MCRQFFIILFYILSIGLSSVSNQSWGSGGTLVDRDGPQNPLLNNSLSLLAHQVQFDSLNQDPTWYADVYMTSNGRTKLSVQGISSDSIINIWRIAEILLQKSICSWDAPPLVENWNCIVQTENLVFLIEFATVYSPIPVIYFKALKIDNSIQVQNMDFYFLNQNHLTWRHPFVITMKTTTSAKGQPAKAKLNLWGALTVFAPEIVGDTMLSELIMLKKTLSDICYVSEQKTWKGCEFKKLFNPAILEFHL